MTTPTATATATAATTRTIDSYSPGTYAIIYQHRLDGPGHIGVYPNDDNDHLITVWYDNNDQHRFDGPASTTSDGDIFWVRHGIRIAYLPEPPSGDRS